MFDVRRFAPLARLAPVMLLGCAAVLSTGCNNNKAEDETAMLNEEVLNVRAELAERNRALEASRDELRDREAEIARLQSENDQLRGDLTEQPAMTGFENIDGVSGEYSPGQVTAVVESDVLFASGRATLRSGAKNSLNAVASVLNSTYGGRQIVIEGHTDTDPIRKSGHKSNYHLGFERSYAVREYLVSRGVSADRISLASFGPHEPKGSKEKSRRVEIVVKLDQ